jgi:hypothetical protein
MSAVRLGFGCALLPNSLEFLPHRGIGACQKHVDEAALPSAQLADFFDLDTDGHVFWMLVVQFSGHCRGNVANWQCWSPSGCMTKNSNGVWVMRVVGFSLQGCKCLGRVGYSDEIVGECLLSRKACEVDVPISLEGDESFRAFANNTWEMRYFPFGLVLSLFIKKIVFVIVVEFALCWVIFVSRIVFGNSFFPSPKDACEGEHAQCGQNQPDNIHSEIPFENHWRVTKGAGNRGTKQAPVVCENTAGCGSPSAVYADRGQARLQVAPISSLLNFGRVGAVRAARPLFAAVRNG